jgi:uncharacterized membrane protein YdjX (TVP38/TMEM64 family)
MSSSTHEPPSPSPRDKPDSLSMQGLRAIWGRLGPAGPMAVVACTLPALGGFLLLGLLNVVGPWLREQGGTGVGLYVLGFTVLAGLALLPTYAQAVLGGWAFGFSLGLAGALAGIVGAAVLGYGVAWRSSGDHVIRIIESDPKWSAVHKALVGSGFWKTLLIVILVRLPSSPSV